MGTGRLNRQKVLLPISFKEEKEEKVEGKAMYENDIVTLKIL
jgi:hypothetical protein